MESLGRLVSIVFNVLGIAVIAVLIVFVVIMFKGCETAVDEMEKSKHNVSYKIKDTER